MALREVFARFAFAFEGGQKLNQASAGVDKLAGKAKAGSESFAGLGAALVGAFAGNALLTGLNTFAAQLDVLDDLSAQTKIATDDLQVLGFAAQKSGSSAEEMNSALTLMQKSLGRTTEATSAQADALKLLKIDPSKTTELAEVLPQVFAEFGNLGSSAEKARVATDLFGRSGVRLIPTLERGQAGLADLRKELEESGGIVSAETIERAGEYRDNLARLDRSMFALKGTIAGALFPQLSKVVEGISKAVGAVSNFTKGTTLADNAGVALAATLAGPLFGALRPFIGKGLKFAAIFTAVDDVIGFLQGKDSLIGRMLDGAFGDGTATAVRMWVNDAIDQFGYFQGNVDGAFAAIENRQASWVTKSMAGFTLLTSHAGATFDASLEGWLSIMNDMDLALERFILSAMQMWNGLLDALVLPDIVKSALKIDTTSQEKEVTETKQRRDARDVRAYQRQTGTGEFEFTKEGQRAAANFGRDRDGMRPGEAGAPVERRAQRIERERQEAQRAAVGLAPAAVQGTLANAVAGGTTATLNDNKTVTINFPPGTTSAQKKEIQAAVAEALRSENRVALEALTQKGKR